MRPDGALTLSTSQQDTEDIYSVTYQAFPWLEGTFRYIIQNPAGKLGSREFTRDRSFEVKALLLEESALTLPSPWGYGTCWAPVFLVLNTSWLANAWAERTLPLAWASVLPVGTGSLTQWHSYSKAPAPARNSGLGGEPSVEDFFEARMLGYSVASNSICPTKPVFWRNSPAMSTSAKHALAR